MHNNLRIYVFKIDGKLYEFKALSKYSAKVRAKRLAGGGNDCEFIGVKEVNSD